MLTPKIFNSELLSMKISKSSHSSTQYRELVWRKIEKMANSGLQIFAKIVNLFAKMVDFAKMVNFAKNCKKIFNSS